MNEKSEKRIADLEGQIDWNMKDFAVVKYQLKEAQTKLAERDEEIEALKGGMEEDITRLEKEKADLDKKLEEIKIWADKTWDIIADAFREMP